MNCVLYKLIFLIILKVLIHTHSHWILLSCLFVSLTDWPLSDRSVDQAGS